MLPRPPTPSPELNAVLQEVFGSLQRILLDEFIGMHLQGSFAVGDFDIHSDCDFVVAVQHELSDPQLPPLRVMHERVFDLDYEWARHLEGSYFPKSLLRDHSQVEAELWYLDNGTRVLGMSRHDNTAVGWWILRDSGVLLAGPSSSSLRAPLRR